MVRSPLVLTLISLPAVLAGQTLDQRLDSFSAGTVHLSFSARPGVCGSGSDNITTREESEEWESDCENGPVRVALRIRNRQVVAIRTYVGGRWKPGSSEHDLGIVRPQDAAAYFLKLSAENSQLNGDPVLPATLADSVTVWPSLLTLARNPKLPEDRRRTAIFWLGQAAGTEVTRALDSVVLDDSAGREVRKQAVFALSQRPSDDGVPALIRIAQTNRDPELRRTALFWLGQSEDPRAIDLFEQILR